MDLIADLVAGRLTEEEADLVLERLQDAGRNHEIADWGTTAGMSRAESHAVAHGPRLREVAHWR